VAGSAERRRKIRVEVLTDELLVTGMKEMAL
jgi:hypothetical protein